MKGDVVLSVKCLSTFPAWKWARAEGEQQIIAVLSFFKGSG